MRVPVLCGVLYFFRRAISIALQAYLGMKGSFAANLVYIVLIFAFLFWLLGRRRLRFRKGTGVLFVMGILCLFSLLLAPNREGSRLFTGFARYCVPGAIIASCMDDYVGAVRFYSKVSLVLFILCAPIPFFYGTLSYQGMKFFDSGMVYGQRLLTPCFFGLHILWRRYGKKWAIVPELACLIITALFANRSSILSLLCFVMLYEVFITGIKNRRFLIAGGFLLVLTFVLYFSMGSIFQFVQQDILAPAGIESRALERYVNMFLYQGMDSNDFSSGRDNITARAFEMILEAPLFGVGMGTFKMRTGMVYTHNFITDALTSFGILGGGYILGITALAASNILLVDKWNKQGSDISSDRNEENKKDNKYISSITEIANIKAIVNNAETKDDEKKQDAGHEPSGNDERIKDLKVLLLIFFCQNFPMLFFSKTFINEPAFWMFLVFSLSHMGRQRENRGTARKWETEWMGNGDGQEAQVRTAFY